MTNISARASAKLAPWLLAFLAGCDGGDESLVIYEDAGELCLFAQQPVHGIPMLHDAAELSFVDGSQLHVTVAAPDCLSSSCDIPLEASCSVEREGNVLRVASRLAFEPTIQALCSRDCTRLVAHCASEPLEAGEYSVVLGEASRALSVPSTLGYACQ